MGLAGPPGKPLIRRVGIPGTPVSNQRLLLTQLFKHDTINLLIYFVTFRVPVVDVDQTVCPDPRVFLENPENQDPAAFGEILYVTLNDYL